MKKYNNGPGFRRFPANAPDIEGCHCSLEVLRSALAGDCSNKELLYELGRFQDIDGSFKLIDSWRIPGDARVDFCYMPTYLGAALLMRDFLHEKIMPADILKRALAVCPGRGLEGHGYDSERGVLAALDVFRQGGLRRFLETERLTCPGFHTLVWNILDSRAGEIMKKGEIRGAWGESYTAKWRKVISALKPEKRLYLAYGSNMYADQMKRRCPNAVSLGRTYIRDWALRFHYYANIEPCAGGKTPAVIWEISADDEKTLDRYEGFPEHYKKVNLVADLDGAPVSVMAYVMTDWKKKGDSRAMSAPGEEYLGIIRQGYHENGFAERLPVK